MKILYYSPHPHLKLEDNTGYGTHMREIIQAFRSLGHEVFPVIMGGICRKDTQDQDVGMKNTTKIKIKKYIPSILWETLKDFFGLNTITLDKDY